MASGNFVTFDHMMMHRCLLFVVTCAWAQQLRGGKRVVPQSSTTFAEEAFLQQTQQDWDATRPVMIASWGGLDGPIGEPDEVNDLFNDIITWDSAKEYFFVKNSPGACNAADINLDALCSQIAYVSMLRKDLFNTFFSNDGNYGHVGRPGLVLKPSYW